MLPWVDLGFAVAGVSGLPQLDGSGSLADGTPGFLQLVDAAPLAPAALYMSTSSTPTPFKGGKLLPVPVLQTLILSTHSQGEIPLAWSAWPAGLSGVNLYFQFAVEDVAAMKGVALSNALGAFVP